MPRAICIWIAGQRGGETAFLSEKRQKWRKDRVKYGEKAKR